MKFAKLVAAAALALGASLSIYADPIAGDIFFAGTGTLNSVASEATSVTFHPNVTIYEEISTGSYGGLAAATTATFTNFNFGVVGTVGALAVNPLWSFTDGGKSYSFSLLSLTLNEMSGSQRNLEGWGVASITGLEDTQGFWSMSTSGKNTSVSFSSYSSVPDSGTTAVLLSVGLVGMGLVSRRKRTRHV
jgi:hypothetical protein